MKKKSQFFFFLQSWIFPQKFGIFCIITENVGKYRKFWYILWYSRKISKKITKYFWNFFFRTFIFIFFLENAVLCSISVFSGNPKIFGNIEVQYWYFFGIQYYWNFGIEHFRYFGIPNFGISRYFRYFGIPIPALDYMPQLICLLNFVMNIFF